MAWATRARAKAATGAALLPQRYLLLLRVVVEQRPGADQPERVQAMGSALPGFPRTGRLVPVGLAAPHRERVMENQADLMCGPQGPPQARLRTTSEIFPSPRWLAVSALRSAESLGSGYPIVLPAFLRHGQCAAVGVRVGALLESGRMMALLMEALKASLQARLMEVQTEQVGPS